MTSAETTAEDEAGRSELSRNWAAVFLAIGLASGFAVYFILEYAASDPWEIGPSLGLLTSAAAFVKEQAYSLQASGWAKAKIGNSRAKATTLDKIQKAGIPASQPLVNAFSASDIDGVLVQAGVAGAPSLWDNVSSAASAVRFPAAVTSGLNLNRKRVKYGKEPIADQIATLAAFRVMGSEAATPAQMSSAMSERETRGCMNMANLNLQQCVAAANQQYEVPFCIGEHALADVGKCIGGVYQ